MKWKKLEVFKHYKQYLYLFLAGFVLLFLTNTPILKGLVGGAQTFTLPLQEAFYRGFKSIDNTFSTLVQIGGLRKTNAELKIENAVLKAENLLLKSLEKENESLRKQLGTPASELKILAAAHPVGKGIFGTRSVLEIDKGERDTVKEGELFVFQNILLGKVVNVTSRLSSVQLLSDPDMKIPVVTSGGAEGISEGEFGSRVSLTNVVQEEKLSEGELVYTSGKGSYPRGLVVGQIEKVNKVEKELFQKAVLAPLFDTQSLDLVYIISWD